MTVKPGASSKVRAMRFLTLVCFFHFSGLNNGFCLMAEQSGRLQSADFASYLLQRVACSLRPARWKAAVSRRGWTALITRSGRVVEVASRQAVQGMLLESSLFQVWAGECLKRTTPTFRISVLRTASSALSVPSSPELGGRRVYLHPDFENAWLKIERFYSWDSGQKLARWRWNGPRPAFFFGMSRLSGAIAAGRSLSRPRTFRSPFRRLMFQRTSGGSDDDPAHSAREDRS